MRMHTFHEYNMDAVGGRAPVHSHDRCGSDSKRHAPPRRPRYNSSPEWTLSPEVSLLVCTLAGLHCYFTFTGAIFYILNDFPLAVRESLRSRQLIDKRDSESSQSILVDHHAILRRPAESGRAFLKRLPPVPRLPTPHFTWEFLWAIAVTTAPIVHQASGSPCTLRPLDSGF